MNCMKCGRETENDSVFCQECLQEMKRYPVQPGAVVLLPRRRESTLMKKTPKRHIPTPEEQNVILRKMVLWMSIALAVCIVAIILMFHPTMHYVLDEHVEIGQNYSSVTPAASSTNPSVED